MSIRIFSLPAFLAVILLIAGCATSTKDRDGSGAPTRVLPMRNSTLITPPADVRGEGASDEPKIFKGTGQLVKGQLAGGGLPAGSPVDP